MEPLFPVSCCVPVHSEGFKELCWTSCDPEHDSSEQKGAQNELLSGRCSVDDSRRV